MVCPLVWMDYRPAVIHGYSPIALLWALCATAIQFLLTIYHEHQFGNNGLPVDCCTTGGLYRDNGSYLIPHLLWFWWISNEEIEDQPAGGALALSTVALGDYRLLSSDVSATSGCSVPFKNLGQLCRYVEPVRAAHF